MTQQFQKKFPQQQVPLSPMENLMSTLSTPAKTPVKPRAISTHMMQNKATYSQPCSTIVFSPIKPPTGFITPLDLRASINRSVEDRDSSLLAYKLQNDKMGQILKDKELMIFELRNKVKEYEVFREEKEQNSAALMNLEKKINDVLNENQRLNQLLLERDAPLKLSQNFNDNVSQLLKENEKLISMVREKQEIIEGKEQENLAIRQMLDEKIRESEVFSELVRKSEALIIENEKLNLNNRQYVKEMEVWKQKFLQIEKALNNLMTNQKRDENMTLSKEIETFFNENIALKEKIKVLMEENKKFNDFFNAYQREKEELMSKKQQEINFLTEENEMKNAEETGKELSFFADIKEKMNALIAENSKLNKICMEKSTNSMANRKNDYQQQMIELQNKLEIMIEENEKLNLVIEEKSNALENAKVEEFLKINEKLKKSFQEQRQEAEMWKKKYQEMAKQ